MTPLVSTTGRRLARTLRARRLPTAHKGNGTRSSHKYETNRTGPPERDQTQKCGEAELSVAW
jgi:hypothetical protein